MSKMLEGKPEAEILDPDPIKFSWKGNEYEILPMPDSLLMRVGDNLSEVTRLFDTIAKIDIGGRKINDLSVADKVKLFVPLIPEIIRLLLPNAARLIGACLRIDEAKVAEEMKLADKLEALAAIVKQEDVPRIVKNFQALTEAFSQA